MRTKTIVLNITTPMDVDPFRSLRVRPDTVTPVVIVGKTTARPAQDRDAQLAKIFNSEFPVAVDVRDRRVLAHPQSAINTRAKMLGKVSMKLGPNQSNFRIGTD